MEPISVQPQLLVGTLDSTRSSHQWSWQIQEQWSNGRMPFSPGPVLKGPLLRHVLNLAAPDIGQPTHGHGNFTTGLCPLSSLYACSSSAAERRKNWRLGRGAQASQLP